MNIHVVGLNYQSASLEIREKYGFGNATSLKNRLTQDFPRLGQGFILATCNRTEWICTQPEELLKYLEEQNVRQYFYHYQETAISLQHLLSVGTGLDSMILGEPQILGQFKQAVKIAKELNCFDNQFDSLIQKIFSAIKLLRSNSNIGKHLLSIGAISEKLITQIFGKQSLKILCFGAGEMIENSLPYWKNHEISIINRTVEKAQRLAQTYHGYSFSLSEWQKKNLEQQAQFLAQYDVIVSCTGIDGYVIDSDLAKKTLKTRHYQTTFYLDLAVPRDIEPNINQLSEIILYDIDHLGQLSEQNQEKRVQAKQELLPFVMQYTQELEQFIEQRDNVKRIGFDELNEHVRLQQQIHLELAIPHLKKIIEQYQYQQNQKQSLETNFNFDEQLQQWLMQHQHQLVQKTLHPFWKLLK